MYEYLECGQGRNQGNHRSGGGCLQKEEQHVEFFFLVQPGFFELVEQRQFFEFFLVELARSGEGELGRMAFRRRGNAQEP